MNQTAFQFGPQICRDAREAIEREMPGELWSHRHELEILALWLEGKSTTEAYRIADKVVPADEF